MTLTVTFLQGGSFADLKAGSRNQTAICALWGTIYDNSSPLAISHSLWSRTTTTTLIETRQVTILTRVERRSFINRF